MTVMKYTLLQPHFESFDDINELRDKIAINNDKYSEAFLPMIPKCLVQNDRQDQNCNRFSPMLTDKGICFTSNGESSQEIFSNSSYIEDFHFVFRDDLTLKKDPKFIKTLVLHDPRSIRPESVRGNPTETPNFYMSFGSRWDPFDIRTKRIEIKAGYVTNVKIVPTMMKSSNNIKNLSPDNRRCKFQDDNYESYLFRDYTQVFEFTFIK